MNFQLCLCGAAPGYPHAQDCPRPLFNSTGPQEAKWDAEHAALRLRIAEHQQKLPAAKLRDIAPEGLQP